MIHRPLIAALLLTCASTAFAQTTYRPTDVALKTGLGTALAVGDAEIVVGWPHVACCTPMMAPEIPGDVLVYRKGRDGSWLEGTRVSAPDGTPDNRLGRALALQGNRMLLGGTKQDDDEGGAYVFENRADGGWVQAARLRPRDRTGLQSLGRAVGLSGDFAFVSTAAPDSGSGMVYVFKRSQNGDWSEHGQLRASDPEPQSFFGLSLSVDGDLLLVGAPFKTQQRGATYVFRHDATSDRWVERGKLALSDDAVRAQFGSAVLAHAGKVIIGAPGFGGMKGRVFVYEETQRTGAWSQTATIDATDGQSGHQFGTALAASGQELWVGAPFAAEGEGRVYVYRAARQAWTESTVIAASGGQRGDFFGFAVGVRGNVAAASALNDDFGEGSVVVFERSGSTWRQVSRLVTEYEGLAPVVGGKVNCDGGMAAGFDCAEMDLVSFLPVQAIGGSRGVEVNDVWGWTDGETGREYALVGRYDGTSFVDVTDPANPRYLGDLPLHAGARGNVWRDIKVYRDHAYIVSDGAGNHGMQVFDLRQLRNASGTRTFTETAHYPGIGSAHNVVINEATGYAYAVGVNSSGETCGGGLHMIDIRNPQSPVFAGCFSHTNTGYSRTGYSHDAMCIIYDGPDVEHRGKEICFGSNENSLSIADVTDKANPIALSSATYPNVSYAHQGWITEDHRYFFMDDEGDEIAGTVDRTRTLIWDVTDLDDPVLAKEFFGTTSASDHNLYIRGNLMYQSNYVAGLRVVDVSDPINPREIGYFDTVKGTNRPGFAGSWSNFPFFASGTVLVTSGKEGLFVLRKKEALVP